MATKKKNVFPAVNFIPVLSWAIAEKKPERSNLNGACEYSEPEKDAEQNQNSLRDNFYI